MKTSCINLPLHTGHAPQYLIKRMIKLSKPIIKLIADEYGSQEVLKRLSDPLWFQSLGCILGFDWHSSGLTTVLTGVLKQSLKYDTHQISVAGGKGKNAINTPHEIIKFEKDYCLSTSVRDKLIYASKITAKVDSTAIQDGYELYHHTIFFDHKGNWAIIQQGMNEKYRMARRYHWISDNISSFVCEPHTGIVCDKVNEYTLNMVAKDSIENQKISLDIIKESPNNIKSSIYKINNRNSLDKWINTDNNYTSISTYEMPRHLNWNLFKELYDIQPRNYEHLLSIRGVGPSVIRALSLIGEIIYGAKTSWHDPVKYNFAHGGKDGVPFPIMRRTYDKTITFMQEMVEGAELDQIEKKNALKRLASYSKVLFSQNDGQI